MRGGDAPTLPPPRGLRKVSPDSPCNAFAQPHACLGLHTPGQLWGQKKGEVGVKSCHQTRVQSPGISLGVEGWGPENSFSYAVAWSVLGFVGWNGIMEKRGRQGQSLRTGEYGERNATTGLSGRQVCPGLAWTLRQFNKHFKSPKWPRAPAIPHSPFTLHVRKLRLRDSLWLHQVTQQVSLTDSTLEYNFPDSREPAWLL